MGSKVGPSITPTPPPPLPDDPNIAAARDRATLDLNKAQQIQAQGDTASIMARYGARLALAGAGALPGVAAGPV